MLLGADSGMREREPQFFRCRNVSSRRMLYNGVRSISLADASIAGVATHGLDSMEHRKFGSRHRKSIEKWPGMHIDVQKLSSCFRGSFFALDG